MRKLLSLALFIILVFSTVAPLPGVRAATSVGGLITSNTTWTHTGSPYRLTSPVGIVNGVMLTIEPGVTVQMGTYYLQINGTLRAQGSINNNIVFDSSPTQVPDELRNNCIQFTLSSSIWSDETGSGSIIENALLNGVIVSIQGSSPKISHNTFNQSGIRVLDGSPFILNNLIYSGSGIAISASGSTIISNNCIKGTGALEFLLEEILR